MKINIFKISKKEIDSLREKFAQVNLIPQQNKTDEVWDEVFYFSRTPDDAIAPWMKSFEDQLGNLDDYATHTFFGAYYIGRKEDDYVYVISFGKAHFYIRPYADFDFGIELAKRIANENDVKQTASRRFSGAESKKIKSYRNQARLDIESGASLDYLSAKIITDEVERFGRTGKFGMSALLNPVLDMADIRMFVDAISKKIEAEPRFKIPRTEQVTDEQRLERYHSELLKAINNPSSTEFNTSSYDIVGVDFIFSGQEEYTFYGPAEESEPVQELTLNALKSYIDTYSLEEEQVFKIRIKVVNADGYTFRKGLLESLDFVMDDEKVILSQGRWLRFNEDYLEQLNDYVGAIDLEVVEAEFTYISKGITEGDFNISKGIRDAGYSVADKDFARLKVKGAKIPTEAWDLYRDGTAYAVKFGNAQKLGYVCDQGMLVMETLRTKSYVKKFDEGLKSYCLWMGYEAKKPVENIAASRSIILKQKVEAWARRCNEVGITPVLKISQIIDSYAREDIH